VNDGLKSLLRWLADLHAPTGRWSPFVAAGCFAGTRFIQSSVLRGALLCVAVVFLLLIAADLARGLLDRQPATSVAGRPVPEKDVPMNVFQVIFVGVVASVYTALIFLGIVGISPLVSLFLLPVIFALACLAAWRNVRLWFQQGAEYEEELKEAQNERTEKEQLNALKVSRPQ